MHPFLKTMFYLGVVALVCSIVGAVCYNYAIGINPIIDVLCDFGLIVGFFLTFFVLILTGCSFLYFLIRLKFKQVGFCVFPCLLPILAAAIIMPASGRIRPKYIREECARHMVEVYKAMQVYANQNNDSFPAEQWCDILIRDYKLNPSSLSCRGLNINHVEGECAFAINKNAIEMKLSEVPPDTVVLFETDYFGENPEKIIEPKERDSGKNLYPRRAVREGAWNQVGGVDIVTCSYHAGLGCNILFADGHVEFVKKKGIPNLRWKP